MATYDKPHLSYQDQLDKLTARGLACNDDPAAIAALKRIGYYRLTAYIYPFRCRDNDGTRLDTYLPGATIDQVVSLHDFDSRLARTLLHGLQTVELGLRVLVAHTLGKNDRFGHLNPASLNSHACGLPSRTATLTRYTEWLERYDRNCAQSKDELFVQHFGTKYDGTLPIWVAVEVLEFGALVRLISFLKPRDRQKICEQLDVPVRVLDGWLNSLNVLRNHCAHHQRLWNRIYPYSPSTATSIDTLKHLDNLSEGDRTRLYPRAAILSHLITVIEPKANWPNTFRTVIRKFPAVPAIAELSAMGFPADWESLHIWHTSS